jgi:hypothetical protein
MVEAGWAPDERAGGDAGRGEGTLAAGFRLLAVDLEPLRRVAAVFPNLVTLVPANAASLGRPIDWLVAPPPPTERERERALMSLGELGWAEPARTDRLLELYKGVGGGLSSRTTAD